MAKILPLFPKSEAYLVAFESAIDTYKINREDQVEYENFQIGFTVGWIESKQNTLQILNNIAKDE